MIDPVSGHHTPSVALELMQHQRRMNATTWARLVERGVNPETELRLDAQFVARAEADARALGALLAAEEGCDIRVDRYARLGFLRRQKWDLTATTPLRTVDLTGLHDWTDRMVTLGQRFRCFFDGWGTMLP